MGQREPFPVGRKDQKAWSSMFVHELSSDQLKLTVPAEKNNFSANYSVVPPKEKKERKDAKRAICRLSY